MRRDIKFRAKIAGTDTWIYGLPYAVYSDNEIDSIQSIETKKVEYIKTDTLGQFIGKYDTKHNEIYDGDFNEDGDCVVWCDECCGWEFGAFDAASKEMVINCHRCDGNFFLQDIIQEFTIIGNVFS